MASDVSNGKDQTELGVPVGHPSGAFQWSVEWTSVTLQRLVWCGDTDLAVIILEMKQPFS